MIYIKEIIYYCSPIFFGGCISVIAINIDKFLIIALLDERELGIYWLAFSLSHILVILRELISRLLLPILSKQDNDKSKILIFEKLNAYLQVFGALSCIAITFWSDIVLNLILGETITLPISFIAGVSFISGSLTGSLIKINLYSEK